MTKTIGRGIKLPPALLPEIEDVTRREFLIGAAGLLLLPAGCGNGEEDASEASGETRTVEHELGATEVPVEPSRVVVLSEGTPPSLIALGLTPVGMPEQAEEALADVAELVPEEVDPEDIERIGDRQEPNLESIAAIGPDMILGYDSHEEFFDKLSEIAPTVLVERGTNGEWRERFLAEAGAVGRGEQAEEVEAAYEQVISELPEEVRNMTVAFIRPLDESQFRVDGLPAAFPGSVAEDAGIPLLEVSEDAGEFNEDAGFVAFSNELLDIVADADFIVLRGSLGESGEGVAEFEGNPLWERLPAVQAGRLLEVPNLFYNGGNHYAAELLLREIEEAVT